MARLRMNLILLILFSGFALNIERLDYGAQEDVIDLASFVYVLFGAAIISTILLPRRWKLSTRSLTFAWISLYFVLKVTVGDNHPMIGGIFTYITIAEIFLLVGFVILTRFLMNDLIGLDHTIANITLTDVSNRVVSKDVAAPNINREFSRGRRYNRPIGVVVVKVPAKSVKTHIDELSKDILQTMVSRYSMNNLIRAIDKEIRRADLILDEFDEDRIVLLLPEANGEVTKTISRKVQKIAESRISSDVAIGTAAFPEDALIFEDLVTFAEDNLTNGSKFSRENFEKEDTGVEISKSVSPN